PIGTRALYNANARISDRQGRAERNERSTVAKWNDVDLVEFHRAGEPRHLQPGGEARSGDAVDQRLQRDHARAVRPETARPHWSLLPRQLAVRERRNAEDAGICESGRFHRSHAGERRYV